MKPSGLQGCKGPNRCIEGRIAVSANGYPS
jgi:hypothetical protein